MLMTIRQVTKRILIADDDPVIRRLVESVVKQQGYTPVTLSDGREAFSRLRTDADFKVAILDMSMPYLQGIDLIRYMQTEKRLMRIPVLLVTAEQDIKLLATVCLPEPQRFCLSLLLQIASAQLSACCWPPRLPPFEQPNQNRRASLAINTS